MRSGSGTGPQAHGVYGRMAACRITLALCCALLATGGLGRAAAQEPVGEAEWKQLRARAFQLFEQQRMNEAQPLLERLAEHFSSDIVVLERLGFAVLSNSVAIADRTERQAARVRARNILLRSQELGNDSNFLMVILDGLPPDGSETPYSANAAAEDAMRQGEAAFVRGEFDAAVAAYRRALELEPELYEAALFIGDVYYKREDYVPAGEWLARAVTINPDRETAYRYWGNAIVRSGDWLGAREKFVEAIVAEPYTRASWVGLLQWAGLKRLQLSHPRIEPPQDDEEPAQDDAREAWEAYGAVRRSWQERLFVQTFGREAEYRHSLAEEAAALRAVASHAREWLAANEGAPLHHSLAALLRLDDEGLLEAYILLARPNEGIAQDYEGYRQKHRDRLRSYLHDIVIPAEARRSRP